MSNTSTPIIDLRTADAFISGHLAGATHIPLSEIDNCWHELPPKNTPLNLCINRKDKQAVESLFSRQHYPIQHIFIADQLESELLEKGSQSRRLWLANPLLEQYIDRITQQLSCDQPLAFDIGCGSGRDSVFLGNHGFQVNAIDNNAIALQRLQHFVKRWSVSVQDTQLDCEMNPNQLAQMITQQQPHLVVQSRYLHRPLLEIYKDYLPAGSIVAIHTFFKEAAKFGKPRNPAFLLARNELADTFSDWNMLLDEVHPLDDGRPLSLFLAQKS